MKMNIMLKPLWMLLLLLLLQSSVLVMARSSGAPEDVCSSLIPGGPHANNGQTSPSPYSITFSPTTYTAGGTSITVTLTGLCGNVFKGFLIEARRADTTQNQNETIGSFSVASGTKAVCINGLTHANAADKPSLTLTWNPPPTSAGHVHFRVIFMQRATAWWGNVKSAVLRDSLVPGTPSTLESASSTIDTSSCPTTAAQTSAPQTTGISEAGCGVTKGCYSDCSGGPCSFVVSWTPEADSVVFEIQARNSLGGDGYMSIGFSADAGMGSDFVSDCKYIGGRMTVTQSYNEGKSDSPQISTNSLMLLSGGVQDGIFSCRFRQPKVPSASQPTASRQPNLNNPFYILFAQGAVSSAGVKSQHRSRYAATAPTSLTAVGNVGAGSAGGSMALLKAHGCMMTIAWLFCASVGILIARHFKGLLPGKKVAGTDIWFQLHRTLMVLTFSLCIAAFVIIFIYAKDWSGDTGIAYRDAHPYLGVIVTFFVVVNPIMALFRPHPGTENRYIFNWAHWGVGTVAHILAVVTIYIGTRMGQPNIPYFVIYFVVAFTVVHVLVFVFLEMIKWSAGKSDRSDSYELQQVGASQKKSSSSNSALEFVKLALFWFHLLSAMAMTIVIVVYIAIAD